MFNVFELGMTAKLDDLLQKLTKFESFGAKELNVELEISGLNLLFIIQVCSNKCTAAVPYIPGMRLMPLTDFFLLVSQIRLFQRKDETVVG